MLIKKLIIVILFIAIVPYYAFSMNIGIGFKGGVSFPYFVGDDYKTQAENWMAPYPADTQPMVSFSGGAFTTFFLTQFLAVQPELLYTIAGGAYGEHNGYINYDKVKYLELPILVKGYLNVKNVKINLFVGPSILFLIGIPKWMIEYDDIQFIDGEWVEDAFASHYFGFVFGGGIDFDLGEYLVTIDARYNLGLQTVMSDDPVELDWKQNNIQIMAGLAIKLGQFVNRYK